MVNIIEELRVNFPSVSSRILRSNSDDLKSCLFMCTAFLCDNPSEFIKFITFWYDLIVTNVDMNDEKNNYVYISNSPFNIRNHQGISFFDACIEFYCKNKQIWDSSDFVFEESVLKYLISKGCNPTLMDSFEGNDSLKTSLLKNRSSSLVKFVYGECYKIDPLILHRRNSYKALPIRVALRYHRDPLDIIEFFIEQGSPVDNLDETGANLLHGLHGHLIHDRENASKLVRYTELYKRFNHLRNNARKDGILPIHSLFSAAEFTYEPIMDKLFDLLMPDNANAMDDNGETVLMAFLSKRNWFNYTRFQRLLDAGADATVGGTLARTIVSGGSDLTGKIRAVEAAGAIFGVTDVGVFFDHIYSQPQQIREISLNVFKEKLSSLEITDELVTIIPEVAIRLTAVYLVVLRQPPPIDSIVRLVDDFGVDINHSHFHDHYHDINTLLLELLSPFRRLDSEEHLNTFLVQLIQRYPHIDLDKADLGAEFGLPYQIALTREAFVASATLVKNFAKISDSLPRQLFVSRTNDFAYFIKTIVAAGLDRNAAISTVICAQMLSGQRRNQLIEWIVDFTTQRVKSLVEIVALHFRRNRDRQEMLKIVNYLPWTERTMKIFYLDHIE